MVFFSIKSGNNTLGLEVGGGGLNASLPPSSQSPVIKSLIMTEGSFFKHVKNCGRVMHLPHIFNTIKQKIVAKEALKMLHHTRSLYSVIAFWRYILGYSVHWR